MYPQKIQRVVQKFGGVVTKNSPTILTGLAVTGLLTTAILAVKATPKALTILAEEQEYRKCEGITKEYELIPKWDAVKLTWKCYLPSAIIGATTIGCIIGANSINLRRNAALAGLYSLSETALKEYQAKVFETIGEKKERAIRDGIAKDRIHRNPVKDDEIVITGKGDTLCYEMLSGRYFRSDIEHIRKCINDISHEMLTGFNRFVVVNDLYYELGLDHTKIGDMVGWRVEDGVITPRFTSQLTPSGEPCLVLDFEIDPKYDYGE